MRPSWPGPWGGPTSAQRPRREIIEFGAVPGYASPIGLSDPRLRVIVDESIPRVRNLVAGANKEGYHLRNVNFPRDFRAEVADIALVREGDRCPKCGGPLEIRRAIELGHIFKLGTKYSEALGATFLDRGGEARPFVMGCYGIGLGAADGRGHRGPPR
jgi:prolyl-tRNA synthetase